MAIPERFLKKAEDLLMEYQEAQKKIEKIELRHKQLISEIKNFAKFKVGEKVCFNDPDYSGEGIIRSIVISEKDSWRNVLIDVNVSVGGNLTISYLIGKMTKSGIIHKLHNVVYYPIKEKFVKLIGD